jgi:pimeloyl-ACP methyl ester carboxylesterase
VTDIVLVPGLWLDGSSWEAVVPLLEQAGHQPFPHTPPGLHPQDTDRSGVGLQDQVDAVVGSIDAARAPVVVVGHSMGAGIAHAAVDARPDRVARLVLVGGFPGADGSPLAKGFSTEGGDLPFPGWDAMDDADVRDLDDSARAALQERMRPSPARLTTDVLHLGDPRRHQVPITLVCPEFSPAQAQEWVRAGDLPELAAAADVEYVDIDSGHWPQVTRPAELAAIIAAAAGDRPGGPSGATAAGGRQG